MQWLGLQHDEGPFYQTLRVERYREVAEQLVKAGKAYYAYESKEEIEAMREQAMAEGRKPRYSGHYRERNEPRRDDPNRNVIVETLTGVPRSVRDNPGSYRSHYHHPCV